MKTQQRGIYLPFNIPPKTIIWYLNVTLHRDGRLTSGKHNNPKFTDFKDTVLVSGVHTPEAVTDQDDIARWCDPALGSPSLGGTISLFKW